MSSFNRNKKVVAVYTYDTTAKRPVRLYPITISANGKHFSYVIVYVINSDMCVAIDHTGSLFICKQYDLGINATDVSVKVDELDPSYTSGSLFNTVVDSFNFIDNVLRGDIFSKIDFVKSFTLHHDSSFFDEVYNAKLKAAYKQGSYAVYNGDHNVIIGAFPDCALIRPATNGLLESVALAVPIKVEFKQTAVPFTKNLLRLLLKVRDSRGSILECVKDITEAFGRLYYNRLHGEASVACDVNEVGFIKTYRE